MSMKCPMYLNFTKHATKKSSSYLSCCIKFEEKVKSKEEKNRKAIKFQLPL